MKRIILTVALMAGVAGVVGAQVPANDPSARLREVLPADVADRVLARIAAARAVQLPAAALEQRALKFAAKGVDPADIEKSVNEQADRMATARGLLDAKGHEASGDEIEAGAEALRQGVDGKAVSALAQQAPSGRSLAVPLYVLGSLVNRGLPSDDALSRVSERLTAGASDADIQGMLDTPAAAHRPAETGRELGAARRGAAGAGRPASIPANPGAGARPGAGSHPTGRP